MRPLGSGKSSLALDTLYAEGQRRYIESFSAYTRQFLQRLEKPEADQIDGIPPAIAVTNKNANRSSRSTVGTATETADYLRLLFAKIGRVYCQSCGHEVRRDSPQSASEVLASLPPDKRFMIAFPVALDKGEEPRSRATTLKEDGFIRVVAGGRMVNLDADPPDTLDHAQGPDGAEWLVIVDRLTTGRTAEDRVRDSLEIAFTHGEGGCRALLEDGDADDSEANRRGQAFAIDSRPWRLIGFSSHLACADCHIEYPQPEPRLYSFNSPLVLAPSVRGLAT